MEISSAYFFTMFVHVTSLVDRTFFERDIGFDDVVPEEIPSQELLSIPIPNCAKVCHDKESCLSFFHSHHDGKCQLFSQVVFTPRIGEALVGNVMFKKKVGGSCEVPTIRNGRVHRVVGHGEGATAYITCDDRYFQRVLYVVCSDGVWIEDLSDYCRYDGAEPYTFGTFENVSPGRCFTILATPYPNSEKSALYLKSDDGSEVFLSVTFKLDENIIERTSTVGGVSDETETDLPFWPLEQGQEVNITLCTEETLYRMYIKGDEMFTYHRRVSTTPIDKIRVIGFEVRRITYSI